MDIVLRDSIINVKTDFNTLNTPWMREFLNKHSRGMLYLQKAVLIFRNDMLKESREDFIKELSSHHASKYDFSQDFFLRSMLKYANQPIRIELNDDEEVQRVNVNLYAYNSNTVLISLDYPNSWVMSYLKSQLDVYIERSTDISFVLDVSTHSSKTRLDRALNKKNVLHYELHYNFNGRFISKLYSDYAKYSFGNLFSYEDDYLEYYMALECEVGASLDDIKNSYKRLAKVYHPDKLADQAPHMIAHYTKKFQNLQEAYCVLKSVS